MQHREDLAVFDKEVVDISKKGVSDWSDFAEVTVAGDDLAPSVPSSVTATQVTEGIKLEWTNPTTNADGTTCNDLRWIKIYYKSTTGVSKTSNDGSYILTGHVGDDQSFTDRIAAKTTRYYVLTALDKSGNESVESSEVHATSGNIYATSDVPDDATGQVFDDSQGTGGIVLGDGIIGIVFRTPIWKSFDRYRLWYQYTDDGGTTWYDKDGTAGTWTEITPVSRFGYVHKGLNTTWGYRYKATVVAKDGTESSTADTAGGATTIPNAGDNENIVGTLILAANIVATNEVRAKHIKTGSVTADKISVTDLSAINANLGTITAGQVTGIDFRTAASGARAELKSTTTWGSGNVGVLAFYDSSNVVRTLVQSAKIEFRDSSNAIRLLLSTFYDDGTINLTDASGDYRFIASGGSSPTASVQALQYSSTGGFPPLYLYQEDISEGLINFDGGSGINRGAISGSTDSVASVRVELSGTVYRLALYSDG